MSFARVRALVVIGVLVLAAVVFVVVAVVRDSQGGPQASTDCPAGWPRANVELPEPKDIRIKVSNGTKTPDLGTRVTDDFKNRQFRTEKPQNNAKVIKGIAVLRYGPKTVGAAHVLRGYFLDEAEPQYDEKRTNEIVDVIIGPDFRQLATTTEVKQSLAQLGRPKLPPGSCAAKAS